VILTGSREAWLPLVISALGFILAGGYGWLVLFRERAGKPGRETEFPWHEALSFAGLNAAGLFLIQLERLVIPHVLPLENLATYGVLAALAGSMFRVLQMGIGYTLVPRLRVAESVLERRKLIAHEARLAAVMIVAGSVAVWLITPVVEHWLLQGKYHLTASLLLAAVISGITKITDAFAKSTVTALATPSELSMVNLLGWASVAVAIAAAAFGARWGLAGVIYGVACGWLARTSAALYFTARHIRLPAAIAATAP
jgi:hypothetical protein